MLHRAVVVVPGMELSGLYHSVLCCAYLYSGRYFDSNWVGTNKQLVTQEAVIKEQLMTVSFIAHPPTHIHTYSSTVGTSRHNSYSGTSNINPVKTQPINTEGPRRHLTREVSTV